MSTVTPRKPCPTPTKRCYRSEVEALQAVPYSKATRLPVSAYRCCCGFFHFTSHPRKETSMPAPATLSPGLLHGMRTEEVRQAYLELAERFHAIADVDEVVAALHRVLLMAERLEECNETITTEIARQIRLAVEGS